MQTLSRPWPAVPFGPYDKHSTYVVMAGSEFHLDAQNVSVYARTCMYICVKWLLQPIDSPDCCPNANVYTCISTVEGSCMP